MMRIRLLQLFVVVLLLAPSLLLADGTMQARVTTRDLGPGLVSFHASSSALLGDRHYVMSRRRTPALLSGYDLARRELTVSREITADGAPAADGRLVAAGDDLYLIVGAEGRRNAVLRYDVDTDAVTQIAVVPAATVWDVDVSPDGRLYIATSRQTQGRLWELDPRSGELRDMGAMETQPRQDSRSVVATSDRVYVGMGYHAVDLWSVDRQTGEKTAILPAELKEQDWIYTLDATEDWIAAGTSGRPSKFAVINRRDYSDYRIMVHGGGTVQSIVMDGTVVYFGGGSRVWRYDIAADELQFLAEMPASRGLFVRNGMLHGASGLGDIAAYDLMSGQLTQVNLVDAGVDLAPEWPQSIAAAQDRVFIGGRALGMIHLESGEQEQIGTPGEAKSMVAVGDHLYMGMYTTGHLVRLDIGSGELEKVAEAPAGQNRPRIVHHDDHNNLILMGTQADEVQGGSLNIYDPQTGRLSSEVNPFGDQAVATITSRNGTAYVAAQREDGPVAAWDPVANQRLWQITPVPGDWAMGLAPMGDRLYGFSGQGTFFVIDLRQRSVIHQEKLYGEGGRLLAQNGWIYGVTTDVLFRIHPQTLEHQVILDGLDSRLFGWPSLAADPQGRIYVIKGTHVLQVGIEP